MSPETFVNINRDKSYRELLEVRDELLERIHEYERGPKQGTSYLHIYGLGPSERYAYDLKVFPKICELIVEKFTEEEKLKHS